MEYIQHLRSLVGNEKVLMVVAGALVFDQDGRLLLQLRTDTKEWGVPGGFMEPGETLQETAAREVLEETGLQPKELELYAIYSGPQYDKTFPNGNQVSLVQVFFTCKQFAGELIDENDETLAVRFFKLDELPTALFSDHSMIFHDLLSGKTAPFFR
ncbi:NUDIX hydrolase [Planococcus sp. YIM B11945]|uniref:NUDIX hydrolase n=1 Tax=Planococcus sp. YIM B11945 TaxID=3435410 RepID=UPI003D7DC0B0